MYAGAVAVPLIVGRALNLSPDQVAFLISADLFAGGLATLVQSFGLPGIGIRLPVMMGVTFASVGPMLAMAATPDVGILGVYGSVIGAGLFALAAAPFVSRLLPLFPPVVTGTIILVIGVSLMRVGINWGGRLRPWRPGPSIHEAELVPSNIDLKRERAAIMTLLSSTYGKGRVRVMRLAGEGDYREVRELEVRAMLTGDIGRAFTVADNATSVSTDTIKNVVNIVARENLQAGPELFCRAVAERFLERYSSMATATVSARETRWERLTIDGVPHPHGFTRQGNGFGTSDVMLSRAGGRVSSGVSGFTFLKATASGWADYIKDSYTTIAETHDRIAATSMEATWNWRARSG